MGVTHEGEISGSGRNTGEVLTHSPSCASPAGRPYLAQLLAAYLPEALAGAPHLVRVRLWVELSLTLATPIKYLGVVVVECTVGTARYLERS